MWWDFNEAANIYKFDESKRELARKIVRRYYKHFRDLPFVVSIVVKYGCFCSCYNCYYYLLLLCCLLKTEI